jgi:hypothetical protein
MSIDLRSLFNRKTRIKTDLQLLYNFDSYIKIEHHRSFEMIIRMREKVQGLEPLSPFNVKDSKRATGPIER